MLQQASRYKTTWVDTVNKVKSEAWNILAKPLATPFFEWEWLSNLESSGCAIAQQGWLPSHLLVWQGDVLVASAPLYLKGHSQGEFVFDHQWADLSYRLGIEYYPKLLGMAPFTPAVGYRFLVHPELCDRADEVSKIYDLMLAEIDRLCDKHQMSGCNFLYVDPSWKHELESRGFTTWMHHSYVWENQEFTDFDDYLKNFNANQRRNIKRERKSVESTGINMRVYTGEEIPHY
ncbi:MAG: peptidogalycan biosysnthesis protein, partial [Pseudanabaena sp.]